MSNIIKHEGAAVAVPPSALNLADLRTLGEVYAKSGFFSDTRDAAQAIVKIMAGQELGFGPIASMTGVYIVKGRVSLSANLIAAAIKRSGPYNYRVREHGDEACEIEFFEHGQSVGTSRFTATDAKRAGTQNMDKFPRNMLFARAMSNGAKWYCADIFGGPVYTPDELGARVDGETGEVIDIPTERAAPPRKGDTGGLRPTPEPESAPATGDSEQEPTAPPTSPFFRQIEALRTPLNWTPDNVLAAIREEFRIEPTGNYADVLDSLDNPQRKTLVELLKAERKQRAA